MDMRDLRRRNALALLKRENITKSELARRLDKSAQHVGVYLRENSQRNIGHSFARLIEKTFGLETGWLDRDHDDTACTIQPGNAVDAIKQANRVAQSYIDARKKWLNARPQAVYMVRSELRRRLIEHSIDIVSETDDEFIVLCAGQPVRIDIFIPIVGFDVYRYRATATMGLPDFLAISVCESPSSIGFYLIPKYRLETIPGNDDLRIDSTGTLLNSVDISEHLNQFSSLR